MNVFKNIKLTTRFKLLASMLALTLVIESGVIMTNSIRLSKQIEKFDQIDISILNNAHKVKFHVVQVQQWLTDISATRGLDGLNDGFDEAKNNALEFKTLINKLKILDSENAERYQVMIPIFDAYYKVGKQMAQAYVDEGPEGGNLMMGKFDKEAMKMTKSVDIFLDNIIERVAIDSSRQKVLISEIHFLVIAGFIVIFTGRSGSIFCSNPEHCYSYPK